MQPPTPSEKRARQLRYWAGTALVYGACFAVLQRDVLLGRIPGQRAAEAGAVAGVALLAFFVLIWFSARLGIANWRLAQAQAGFAVVFDILLYAFLPAERSAAILIGLPVIIVFCAFALRPRQTLLLAGLAAALLLCTCLLLGWQRRGLHGFGDEMTNFALAAIGIVAVGMVTGDLARLRGQLVLHRQQLQDALARIERAANTDELTDLLNRHGVRSRFGAGYADPPLTLAVIDIDHFKRLNDTLGHDAGDAALRRFAEVARQSVRARDAVARWGGEEFLVVMPDTALADAGRILERLRQGLRAGSGAQPALTVSAGVVQQRAGESFDQMVARADALMYAAKQAGRDAVRLEGGAPG